MKESPRHASASLLPVPRVPSRESPKSWEPKQARQEAHKRRPLERSALGLDSVVSFAARVGVGARGRARGAAGCAPLAAGAGADAFATPPMPAFPSTAFSVWIRTPRGGGGTLQDAVFPD
jgi:hypothetical protein